MSRLPGQEWHKSPIYCDNRITMSYPAVRKEIAEGLAAKLKRLSQKSK